MRRRPIMTPRLPQLVKAFEDHPARSIPGASSLRHAAVAAVLREPSPGALEVLMIKRAEHPNDRWSGHMAFPGGRVDPGDASPLDAAIREVREEIGLDLVEHGEAVGALSQLMAKARGKVLPLVISPFVFTLDLTPPLTANAEVDEIVWVPLDLFLDRANRATFTYRLAKMPLQLPCYYFEGRKIWGLTLRMLDELTDLARKTAR